MSSGSTALFGFGALPLALGALVLFGPPSAPAVQTITVTADEFTLTAPDTLAAGAVTFRLENQGKEFHHLWIARLEKENCWCPQRRASAGVVDRLLEFDAADQEQSAMTIDVKGGDRWGAEA